MKIVFFGSSNFAVPVLEALQKSEEVLLVVTQPDRKKGRALKISSTPVKVCADKLGIKAFQTSNVNLIEALEYLKKLNADLFIVVSFGQILSKKILELPKLYPLNVHASLLPKYRGAAPINWAIANGEKETGVTIMMMNEKMDEGDILLKESVLIDDKDDAIALSGKLSKKGAELLIKAIELIKSGKVNFIKQDNKLATYAPKLKKEDGIINWNLSAEEICNRVRAFVPWPGCFTYWDKKILKIWKAKAQEGAQEDKLVPGTVAAVHKESIQIKTGKGVLAIKELQLEASRRMKVEKFTIGHTKLVAGANL